MVKLFIFLLVLIAEKIAVNGLPESLTGGLKDKRSAFVREEIQDDEEQIKCFPGIKRFSSLDERKYYSCKERNGYAVLKTCPGNQLYWPQKEICYQPDEDVTQGDKDVRVRRANNPPANNKGRKATIINRKLLRSDVSLGEFYDAKNDQFLSGVSLWSMEELEKHRKRRFARPSTNYQFDSGKTEDNRMNLMDIDASLKLSFMGGLIEVSGSAQYVRQSDVLTTDETFTLAYKSTSFYNVLPVTAVKNFPKQCDNKQATHVVSKVVYGQNAYYFFKRSVSRKEKKEEIAGSLKVLVKAIPAFSIEGSATVKVEGEEKRFRESVQVRFNGDFKLPGGFPATFEEAVKSFKKLQDYTAQPPDYVNAVPVEVQLTPIQDFCDATDTILVSIGDSLTQKTAEMLSHFNVLSMEINTLLNSGPAFEYPVIRENLNLYKIKLNSKLLKIKEKLQTLLPDIRAGKEGAKELNNLLVENNESPFEFVKSEAFLNSRSLEIRALNLLTDGFNEYSLKNFRVADFKQPTRAQIMMNYHHVVVLDVNILQSKQITQKFLQNEKINSSFWYKNDTKASELGTQKKLFKKFLEANQNSNKFGYLISINLRDEYQPIRVQAKRSGVADSLDFIIPDVRQIGKPKVTFVSYDHFKISVTKPNNTWVTHFLVEYWLIIDDSEESKTSLKFAFSQQNTQNVTITNLNYLTTYEVRIVHVTEFGISPNGEKVSVTTKPSSEPTMLKFQSSESSLNISWSEPVYQANGIKIKDYRVVLKDSVGQVVADQQVQDVTNIKFDNLNAITKYIVIVKAIAEFIRKDSTNTTKKIQEYSHPATLIAFTAANPLNPNSFQANADYYSVTLDLGKSNITQVPRVTGYVVRYSLMDSTGQNIKPGTSRTQSFPGNNDPKKIIGLASGFTYGLEVQEITTFGKSIFSSPIFIVRTDPRVETNIQQCSWTIISKGNEGPVKYCYFNKKHSTTSLLVSVKTMVTIFGTALNTVENCVRYYVTFNGNECFTPIDQALSVKEDGSYPLTFRGICKLTNRSGADIKVELNVSKCPSADRYSTYTGGSNYATSSIIIEEVENARLTTAHTS